MAHKNLLNTAAKGIATDGPVVLSSPLPFELCTQSLEIDSTTKLTARITGCISGSKKKTLKCRTKQKRGYRFSMIHYFRCTSDRLEEMLCFCRSYGIKILSMKCMTPFSPETSLSMIFASPFKYTLF